MPFFKVGAIDVGVFLLTGLFDFAPPVTVFGDLGDLERGDLGDCFPSLFESTVDFSSVVIFSSTFSSSSGFLSLRKKKISNIFIMI